MGRTASVRHRRRARARQRRGPHTRARRCARRVGRARPGRARPVAPPGRRRRPRSPGQRRDAGGRGRRRAHRGGRRRAPGRRAADARGGVPGRRPRRRPRRDDLRVAQRHAGQRHQALRRRWAQAARRRRGRGRGPARRRRRPARPARASAGSATCPTTPTPATSTICSSPRPAPLDGLRVVVDCAHGAASAVAPEVYRRAGAEVIAIAAEPDGLNINDGVGSTHLGLVRAAVLEHGADLGIAHDGDADRCLAVDASGADVDGDRIMAILALAMRDANELAANTLVATVMSNLGLHLAMRGCRDRRAHHRGRRPLRAGGAARGRFRARRRAVRPRRPARARHHRRRAADGAAADGADGGHRADAGGARVGRHRAARRCWRTCGWSTRRRSRRRTTCAPPSPTPSGSWATPGGCCSGRRAPSSWCG